MPRFASTPQSRTRARNRQRMRANFVTRQGFDHIAPLLSPVRRQPHESVEHAIDRAAVHGRNWEPSP